MQVAPSRGSRRRPRPTQAERRSRTRASVLASAGKVFAKRGYEGASLDEIAEEAGLSKGAVYYNFASKEELFLTLLEERLAERLREVEVSLANEPGTQSADAASVFLEKLEHDPRWAPLFFEFVAFCARDPARRRHFAERFLRATRRALAQVVERRYAALGADPPLPPDQLATVIAALTNGMVIERLFDPAAVPEELLGRGIALMARPAGV